MFIEASAACGDDWSNFFLRFFTLNALPRESNPWAGTCLWRGASVAPPSLSSRVLEAERTPGRVPVPLRTAAVGVCRLGGRAGEAIASWVGEDSETTLAFAVCTPR